MNFLIIDGNSIINRAFYGIRLLTAKDGHFTNAIFGFMNIFMNLVDLTKPECAAVAFDVREPTFRHKMYEGYKAGRKGMPAELFEQMEPLKEILRAYGCHIVECPGFEADDILGTLSHNCPDDCHCYIATGDRDSLQLVSDNVSVLLTTTKMGKTQTVEYTPEKLFEEYGLAPAQMIELKALQGDNSDNIPGVAGIGPKTAGELIKKYRDIDTVFASVDSLDVSEGVKNKLRGGRDSAYLSKRLGTIVNDAPIEKNISAYGLKDRDDEKLLNELVKHELFKAVDRLGLKERLREKPAEISVRQNTFTENDSFEGLKKALEKCKEIYLSVDFDGQAPAFTAICVERSVFLLEGGDIKEALPFMSDCKITTLQSKEIYKFCISENLSLPGFAFDIRLAAYLLDPNASDYSAENISLTYNLPFPEVVFSREHTEKVNALIRTAAVMPALKSRLEALIAENGQNELLCDIEIPLARVLASMEYCGMAVSREAIEAYSLTLSEKIKALEGEIYKLTDSEFNINSPKQLSMVLFDKMGLPAKKKSKAGYSTSAEVLEELADESPAVEKILEYRAYTKLKNTYCDGLIKAVQPDGRIRSTFNQTETRTGRLSSAEPNLQNIPVRTTEGREFRKFFCAKQGNVIVDADYSQIELRVLAALSDDENMIAAFNSGEDIHTVTAAKVFNVPENEVGSELRSKAKAVNFGIVYGIGAFSLAKDIKSSRKEADEFIKSYLSLYRSVDAYMKNSIVSAKANGYVSTLFARRRPLPELKSSNAMLRSFGERVARNMPVQGTAADIIKIAMIKVSNRLSAELPEARLIMQVHDELILEVPEKDAGAAAVILKEEMENAVSLSVKLCADVGVGKTWYEAKG